MKKTILFLLAAAMLFTLPVSAQSEPGITFAAFANGEDEIYYLVDITGSYEEAKDSILALKITNSAGDEVYLNQTETDDSGNYGFLKILIRQYGDFTAYINSSAIDSVKEKSFSLPLKEEYTTFLDILNEEDETAEEYEGALSAYAAKFGLDTKFYDLLTTGKSSVLNELVKNKGKYTVNNLSELFLDGLISGIMKSSEDAAFKDTVLSHYIGSEFIIEEKYEPLYESYTEFSDELKTKVWSGMSALDLSDNDKILNALYVSVIKTALSELNTSETDEFLTDNQTAVSLPGYTGFTAVKKGKILNKLISMSFDSITQFEKNYTDALSDVEAESAEENKQPQYQGGGGLGGGGGGGGGAANTVDYPLEAPEDSKAPEDTQNQVSEAGFTDLDDYPWAKEAILYFKKNGVVNGKTDTLFAPGDDVTRAEFCKILVNAFGLSGSKDISEFYDVTPQSWYYPYVAAAYENGIISGFSDGSFQGDSSVTREQMVTMLYRYMQRSSMIEKQDNITNTFGDYNEISDYAKNAVLILSNAGYVKGVGENTFLPKKEAGRAEVCLLVYNILKGEK